MKWIPIKEREPEKAEWYLVTKEDWSDSPNRWSTDLMCWSPSKKDFYNPYTMGVTEYSITAWMELPEPYKEEKGNGEEAEE